MRICLATYQSAMLLKGGPRTQIFQTKRALEKLDVEVMLFESWQDINPDKFDLIHVFGANIGTYHFVREIHKLGIPFVVSPIIYTRRSSLVVRSVVVADSFVRKVANGAWTDYGLESEICSWATAIFPNTHREALLVEQGLGISPDRIMVIPNGVEERFYDGDPALFKQQHGMENFILNVGHIGPKRKNVLALIRALEHIDHPAVLIGRIEQNEYGNACLQRAKSNPRLLVLDHLPNDSGMLASAYAASNVFVLPSQFETPGIAALEAAIAGSKIVITKYGGTEEYFGSYAEYVEPDSVEEIYHSIQASLQKEKNNNLREHIRNNFTWDIVGEKTLTAYKACLS